MYNTCTYVCIYICTYVYGPIYITVHIYMSTIKYICIYACMYRYVCIYIYVCVYVHMFVCDMYKRTYAGIYTATPYGFWERNTSQDSAANVVRFAKAVHEEAPNVLRGVATLSAVKLPHAEESIHEVISEWGFTLPLELYIWQRGLVSAPMLRTGTWFEYLLVRHPGILLGGFPLKHPALPGFLRAFWKAFEYDEPNHAIYTVHSNNLDACIPICFYGDEGRGVRKSPIQITALETLFGQNCFQDFLKLEKKNPGQRRLCGTYNIIRVLVHLCFRGFCYMFCQTKLTRANATACGMKFVSKSGETWLLPLRMVCGSATSSTTWCLWVLREMLLHFVKQAAWSERFNIYLGLVEFACIALPAVRIFRGRILGLQPLGELQCIKNVLGRPGSLVVFIWCHTPIPQNECSALTVYIW